MKHTPRPLILLLTLALSACAVGPNYHRPDAPMSQVFKEAEGWSPAFPSDDQLKGSWWNVYQDPVLSDLISQVPLNNQTVAGYVARYAQAQALTEAARSAYFPVLSATGAVTRSRSGDSKAVTNHSAQLSLQWEVDLWGKLRRAVEEQTANTQASAADLENARLSAQAQLASDYFLMRSLDSEKQILDQAVEGYQRSFQLTQNQYRAGVVARSDVVTAETQLRSAQAQSIDVGVQRAQLEHAIAILIGKAPADLTLPPSPLLATAASPVIAAGIPSHLLERRPDIAAAERRMKAANAEIGVQTAAYFPSLTLDGALGFASTSLAKWFTAPARVWSVGPQLAYTLFDNGQRAALVAQARSQYDASVAAYRETVLVALQQVEDDLVALRLLGQEQSVEDDTVNLAQQAVTLALNRYRAGTTSYVDVVTVQTTALNAERTQIQLVQRRLAASVQLVEALGGGWDASQLPYTDKS